MMSSLVDSRNAEAARFPLLRALIAVGTAPWLVCGGFALLARYFDARQDLHLLLFLPFDAPVTAASAYLTSLCFGVLLCLWRVFGPMRWWQCVSAGAASSVTAAMLGTQHFMPRFWLASFVVGTVASTLIWLLITPEQKPHGRAIRWAAGLVGAAVLFVSGILSLLSIYSPISHFLFIVLPTADGGRISNYAYFESGFLDVPAWL